MVKFASEETHSQSGEENEYDEEDFEQEEDDENHHHGGHLRINTDAKSPKKATSKSPKKRIGTPGNDLRKSGGSQNSSSVPNATNSNSTNSNKDGKGLGGDLERYLAEMESDHEGASNDDGLASKQDELQKALRPLDGMKPDSMDEEQKLLYRKFGHSHGSDDTPSKGASQHPSPSKRTQPPQINPHAHAQPSSPPSSSLLTGSEKDQAVKINAFLSELFPERYAAGGGDAGKKKKAGKKVSVAGKGGGHHVFDVEHEEIADLSPENIVSTLDTQLKAMKRELKMKDDKIRQLKDHSSLMATHLDRLKEEVVRLNNKLQDAEMALEAKDERIKELVKPKKKKKKPEAEGDGQLKTIPQLEAEVLRLREREQALLDAVEELSIQNEDLIVKLRESMQRELTLSSKRAQQVSHSLLPKGQGVAGEVMLPSIYADAGGRGGGEVMRTQSEPMEMARGRGVGVAAGKKKKKQI